MTHSTDSWDIPSSWGPAQQAAREGGLLLVLGASDSGKSTLTAVLANVAVAAGRATAIVDSDVGQSSIGPPTCVSMARVLQPIAALDQVRAEALDFVGTPSPVGHLLGFVASAQAMVRAARNTGPDTILVDTTGLIAGPLARVLKGNKIRLLDPDIVIALQLEEEVEHLLAPYRAYARPQILRLAASRKARSRSREQRAANRQRAFASYFRGGRVIALDWKRLPMENTAWTAGEVLPGHLRAHAETVLGCEVLYAERGSDGHFLITAGRADRLGLQELKDSYGASTRAVEVGLLQNLLVGLLGPSGETRALGILEQVDFRAQRLEVFAPVPEVESICGIRLGAIQISRDGTQLAWLEPGDLG